MRYAYRKLLLLLILVFISGCKKDYFYDNQNDFIEVYEAEITDFPSAQITFRLHHNGDAGRQQDVSLDDNLEVSNEIQDFVIDEFIYNNPIIQDTISINELLPELIIISDKISKQKRVKLPLIRKDFISAYPYFGNHLKFYNTLDMIVDSEKAQSLKPKTINHRNYIRNLNNFLTDYINKLQENGNSLLENDHAVIISINGKTKFTDEHIDKLQDIFSMHPRLWFGVLYEYGAGMRKDLTNLISSNSCLFIRSTKGLSVQEQGELVLEKLHNLQLSQYRLDISFRRIVNPNQLQYNLKLKAAVMDSSYATDCTIQVDRNVIRDYYINVASQNLEQQLLSEGYFASLTTAYEEYMYTGFDEFYSWSVNKIEIWLTQISTSHDQGAKFNDLKLLSSVLGYNGWDFTSETQIGVDLLNLLIEYGEYLKVNNADLSERITVYERIRNFNDSIKQVNLDYFECLGDLEQSKGKFETAIEYFRQVLEMEIINRVQNKYHNCFQEFVSNCIDKGRFSNAQSFYTKYSNEWGVKESAWYNALRERYLYAYAEYLLNNQRTAYDARVVVYNEYLNLNPSNNDVRFDYNVCLGDRDTAEDLLESSLKNYRAAFGIRNNSEIWNKLHANLSKVADEYYASGDIKNTHHILNEYFEYAESTFKLRYYLADASKSLNKYSQAIDNYKWLTDNWELTSFIEWNDLLNILLDLYSSSMRHKEAYHLLKRMIINDELLTKYDYKHIINFLRGMYLAPYAELAGEILKKQLPGCIETHSLDLSRLILPAHIESIYTLDYDKSVIDTVYTNGDKIQIPELLTDDESSSVSSTEKIWLIQPVEDINKLFVIQIGSRYAHEETIMLKGIANTPQRTQLWVDIESYMFNQNVKNLSQFMSSILGISYILDDQFTMSDYNKIFNKSVLINYTVIQDRTEQIVDEFNFDISDMRYQDDGWEDSSQAILIHAQEVNRFQNSIYDIANPIYYEDYWRGIVRFGFSKD